MTSLGKKRVPRARPRIDRPACPPVYNDEERVFVRATRRASDRLLAALRAHHEPGTGELTIREQKR